MSKRQTPVILNLAGTISDEMDKYLVDRTIRVIENPDEMEWTHLLTRDEQDFAELDLKYNLVEQDLKIISLTTPFDLQDFSSHNGRLIYHEEWFKEGFGELILDKFFQGYSGITLEDNYPKFQEMGSFNVVNPFNTGEHMDRMVHSAFSSGIYAFSTKTYLDHLLMYLTALKSRSRIGFPLEVTYGTFNKVFGLQIHFFAQEFRLEETFSSLSPRIGRNPEDSLLNIAILATDFFDLTLLKDVNKVVLTALWMQGTSKIPGRGLLLNEQGSSALNHFSSEGSIPFVISGSEIPDLTSSLVSSKTNEEEEKEVISGKEEEDNSSQIVSGKEEEDNSSQIVSGKEGEDNSSQTVSGKEEEDNSSQTVPGGKQEKEENQRIAGSKEEVDDVINLVKGSFEEEKTSFRIAGQKIKVEELAQRISQNIDEKAKGDMRVKSLEAKLPDSLKTGLFDFAKGLNKNADDLDDDEIKTFEQNKLPDIVKKLLISGSLQAEEKSLGIRELSSSEEIQKHQNKIKDLEKKNQGLTKMLDDYKLKLSAMVASSDKAKLGASHTPDMKVQIERALDEKEKQHQEQITRAGKENDLLKAKVRTLGAELKVMRDSQQKQAEIKAQVESATQAALAAGGNSSEKLNSLVDNDAENKLKKVQVELTQKEIIFAQELEKLQRTVAGKDLMLIKAKESLRTAIENKENQIRDLQAKNAELLVKEASSVASPDQNQGMEFHDFETKSSNSAEEKIKLQAMLAKSIKENEHLKSRISTLGTQMESLRRSQGGTGKGIREEDLAMKEALIDLPFPSNDNEKPSRDIHFDRSSESFLHTIKKQEQEIATLKDELANLNANAGAAIAQQKQLQHLERQNQNLTKMSEVYKTKISTLVAELESLKSSENKDDSRRLQLLNNQSKNVIETLKRDVSKLQEKASADNALIMNLKQEKSKLEQELKRAQSTKVEQVNNNQEAELKKSQVQQNLLESKIKESTNKVKELEAKLQEALKNQRTQASGEDTASKSKISHLEASVKKLTQDLVDTKNQLSTSKKDVNKIRQEKTAVQNELDRLKKEAAKTKAAMPKKPGGRAA